MKAHTFLDIFNYACYCIFQALSQMFQLRKRENSNCPNGFGEIDPDDFSPFPKNPIISKFFREIGLADELGSGVRNINKLNNTVTYFEVYADDDNYSNWE